MIVAERPATSRSINAVNARYAKSVARVILRCHPRAPQTLDNVRKSTDQASGKCWIVFAPLPKQVFGIWSQQETETERSWGYPYTAPLFARGARPVLAGVASTSGLARHEAKRTIDRAQHPVKFMSASNDQPACGNHAVDALPQG